MDELVRTRISSSSPTRMLSRHTKSHLTRRGMQFTSALCIAMTLAVGAPSSIWAAPTGVDQTGHRARRVEDMGPAASRKRVAVHPTGGPAGQPELTFTASNGFVVGARRDKNNTVFTATSPWSETLELRVRLLRSGVTELRFGATTLRSRLPDNYGPVKTVEVVSPQGTAVQKGMERQVANLRWQGVNNPGHRDLDMRAYDLLTTAALAEASTDFWRGLDMAFEEFDAEIPAAVPVGCGLKGIRCFATIALLVGSVAALIALCGGTFGAGCVAGILAQEGTAGLALAECVDFAICAGS
ncbi:MAG: hypothetical protein ACE5IK_06490 [Acidobacteriota bacterium]